jgi:hypothetical protein
MSAIAIPDVLGRFVITTLTFEDLASLVVRNSGQQQGQVPYMLFRGFSPLRSRI